MRGQLAAVAVVVCALAVPGLAHAAPPNDAFAGPQTIAGISGTVEGTTLDATSEAGEPALAGGYTVWYAWTATSSATVSLDLLATTSHFLAVFTGDDVATLTRVADGALGRYGDGALSHAEFAATEGVTYRFLVDTYQPAPFTLLWSATGATPPPNDGFASPESLTGRSGSVYGSTRYATAEPGEPGSLANQHSIWYSWTPDAYGTVNFTTGGTTYAWFYTGDALDSLELLINGQGYGFVHVRPGVTYRIALDDWSSGGPTRFTWTFDELPPPPANDDWANAQELDGTSGTVELDNTGATREPCEPYLGSGRSAWYSWTAPADGELTVDPDSIAGVYTGSSACLLEQRGWSGGDPAYVDVVAGETYWIGVDTFGFFGPTSFSWSFAEVTRPANDMFAAAQDLGPAYRGSVYATTFRATAEPGEYFWWGHTVWYAWTPAESGVASIDVQLADGKVFTGDAVGTLSFVAYADAQFEVAAGTTYYVQVDGGGRGGDFGLEWLLQPDRPPLYDDFANAEVLDGPSGRVEATNRLATTEPGEPDHGGTSSASVWFAWTAPADGTATFHVDSSFWTIHRVYTGESVDALTVVDQTQDVEAQLVSLAVQAGVTYRIAVDGRAGGTGVFWLDWSTEEGSGGGGSTGSAPEPAPDEFTTNEDEPLTVTPKALTANDYDADGDALVVASVAADKKSHGTVKLTKGRIVFTPEADFNGTGRFSYRVVDPLGNEATALVTVDILPVNDAPTVKLTADTWDAGEGGSVAVAAAAEDVDGDPLTYEWTTTEGTVEYDGATASVGVDDGPATVEVRVVVSDGVEEASAAREVTVANVAPTVEAQSASGVWGVPVTISGSAADPSAADTAAGLVPSWSIGGSALTVTRVFDVPGSYAATLSVSDKDGGTGTRDVTFDVGKRASTLAYAGDAAAPFGFGVVAARAGDAVDARTARLDGRGIAFRAGGSTFSGTTSGGVATAAVGAALMPGTYDVRAQFAEDGLYLASEAAGTLTVANSVGKMSGDAVLSDGTAVSFNVSHDGTTGKGTFAAGTLTAGKLTALGISGRAAWFAGTGADGRAFLAYAEDNGEPGRGVDVLRLWIAGEPQAGSGVIAAGNLQLHK
jgi:Big-like domain-containing protein